MSKRADTLTRRACAQVTLSRHERDYSAATPSNPPCRSSAASFAGADFAFAHLTNHCLAARHPDYGRIAPGNEGSFESLQTYLTESGSHWSVSRDLWPQIQATVALAFESVREVTYVYIFA